MNSPCSLFLSTMDNKSTYQYIKKTQKQSHHITEYQEQKFPMCQIFRKEIRCQHLVRSVSRFGAHTDNVIFFSKKIKRCTGVMINFFTAAIFLNQRNGIYRQACRCFYFEASNLLSIPHWYSTRPAVTFLENQKHFQKTHPAEAFSKVSSCSGILKGLIL